MQKFIMTLLKRILKYTLVGGILVSVLVFSGFMDVERSSFIIDLIVSFMFASIFCIPIAILVSIFIAISSSSKKQNNQSIIDDGKKNQATNIAPENKIEPVTSQSSDISASNILSKNKLENEPFCPVINNINETKLVKKVTVTKTLLHLTTLTDYKNFKDYIVLDVETTGLDRTNDKIIEIGMIKVENGEVSDYYESLVNPGIHIPSAASKVNGIYDKDVAEAPTIENIIDGISTFIETLPIVGHNTNFDIAFLAREMSENGIEKHLYYYDTISICKDVALPVPNHKLETIMKYFEIKDVQAHRAVADAEVTLAVLQKCIDLKFELHEKELVEKREKKKAEEAIRQSKYGASPLYNVGFVFTGDFDNDREDMIRDLKSVGGLLKDRVSKNSRYLVKGDIDDLPDWAIERKYEKALDLIDAGNDIEIISEDEFYDLIENAKTYLD